MEFEYKNKKYMLGDIKELGSVASYDIVAIFQIFYDEELETEKYKFIDYFYGADDSNAEKTAKTFIDNYEKEKNYMKLKDLKKVFINLGKLTLIGSKTYETIDNITKNVFEKYGENRVLRIEPYIEIGKMCGSSATYNVALINVTLFVED